MEKETEIKTGAGTKLGKAIGGFIGRVLGNIILGFLRALIQALVLSYPLKWLWNDLAVKLDLKDIVLLDFGTAFKIILLYAFITKMSVTRKTPNEEVVEV